MIIALYGCHSDIIQFDRLLLENPGSDGLKISIHHWEDYDSFILEYRTADALFVLADGGEGLEVMNAAETIDPQVPRVWFTDDSKLGPQALRMKASFFAVKPITSEIIMDALAHCGIKVNYVK